ncbi:hypothetical protein V490_03598 [Pseudogymnoascus sp. VKM F-3557]|nr:hypothetical protein V490_03598 [Pseudogymnoascus sp. VKM F-3557]
MAANGSRMPPPPPNHGFQQAPPGMVQGGPPMNRPPQLQQPRQQYPPMYQQNYQQGGAESGYKADTIINASTRIHDIRPQKTESESFCKKQLTTYEVFTILPNQDDDGKSSKDSKGSKDSKDKKKDIRIAFGGKDKDKDDKKTKKRERWAKVQINQESYPTEQIIKTIQKLDAGHYSITEKKAKLFPNQSTQVTNILDDKIRTEHEGHLFEWVLAQLHREESVNSKTGKKETTSMTIYLKRAPLPNIDVIQLYRERQERARIQAMHRQPQIFQQQQPQIFQQQQQAHMFQQQQAHAMQQQMGNGQYMPQNNRGVNQQQQQPRGDGWPKPNQGKNAPAGVKIIQDPRPGTPAGHKLPKGAKVAGTKIAGSKVRMMSDSDYSTDDDSDSDFDSDFSHYDSEGTPHTSSSSRSGGRKYPRAHRPLERSRERRRSNYDRGDDFVFIEGPKRRHSVSYAPDVPRLDRPHGARVNSHGQPSPGIGAAGFDTEAFAAGVAAGTRAAAIIQPAAQFAVAPPQRLISNIERTANDDALFREEQRRLKAENIMRQDALREARIPYERDLRSVGGRGYSPPPRRYLDEDRERLYRDEPMSPSVSSMSSGPLPRGRSGRWSPGLRRRSTDYDYPLREGLQRIPLDEDREFDYVRNPNPFQPRRDPRPYRY